MVRTALISVSDKRRISTFATRLHHLGFRLLSTGGTANHLRAAGLPVTAVSDWTGFAELLDGRVKTLHPRIHAAILADRDQPSHRQALDDHDIETIDLVVCNLYPFQSAQSSPDASRKEILEQIDIGGCTLLRAAAKNYDHLPVVVDRDDYSTVADALANDELDLELRRRLALRAFRHTAAYDAAIVDHLQATSSRPSPQAESFPESTHIELHRQQRLRYGENPHQKAALYRDSTDDSAAVTKLHGKALSYNNLVDLDAALQLVWEFSAPTAAIIKHTNPAGCATAPDIEAAFERALAGDPMSAFGGIVALNKPLTSDLAKTLHERFFEVITAPAFTDEALAILTDKKNIRLMQWTQPQVPPQMTRTTSLGWLVQDADPPAELSADQRTVATEQTPTEDQWRNLEFAWKVAKHVKSNAIVLAQQGQIIGVGAGQMSRVDAVEIAIQKCVATDPDGAVLASDAFFPFRDGLDAAAKAGIRAVIQPGGSRRDAQVIDACNEHGVAMVMTGRRHFRHS